MPRNRLLSRRGFLKSAAAAGAASAAGHVITAALAADLSGEALAKTEAAPGAAKATPANRSLPWHRTRRNMMKRTNSLRH